jgi:hypothetical protein
MASSSEAFARFGKWKKSRTVLRLTVRTNGRVPEIWQGMIFSVDESAGKVGFADDPSHFTFVLELEGALFTLDARSVDVDDPRVGSVLFEEIKVPVC